MLAGVQKLQIGGWNLPPSFNKVAAVKSVKSNPLSPKKFKKREGKSGFLH